MKLYFEALAMCQSMFCAIALPINCWNEKAKDKMLLFLPLVGLEIGFLWAFAGYLAAWFALPKTITAVLMTALPFVLTGYIHLDGFMDVTDAIGSCRDLSRRREILKDPHVGSFAVIGCVLLMLFQFGCFLSVKSGYGILLFLPAVSRCCSALAITVLKPMSTSQYACQEKTVSRCIILTAMLLCFSVAGFAIWGNYGFVLLGCILACAFSIIKAYRNLDGMNGDISGYAITMGELCGVAVLAITGGML